MIPSNFVQQWYNLVQGTQTNTVWFRPNQISGIQSWSSKIDDTMGHIHVMGQGHVCNHSFRLLLHDDHTSGTLNGVNGKVVKFTGSIIQPTHWPNVWKLQECLWYNRTNMIWVQVPYIFKIFNQMTLRSKSQHSKFTWDQTGYHINFVS